LNVLQNEIDMSTALVFSSYDHLFTIHLFNRFIE
jgi:hypothetical protein